MLCLNISFKFIKTTFLLKIFFIPIAITYPRGVGSALAGNRVQRGSNYSQIRKEEGMNTLKKQKLLFTIGRLPKLPGLCTFLSPPAVG
jgi:hypothetical protein